MGGMMTSLTSELTIAPKAAPMITPTARSTALPLIANSRNSFSMRSTAERRLHLLEGLEVLLQPVHVLLHLDDRGAELRHRAGGAAGAGRLLHRLPADVTELRVCAPLAERPAEEPRGEEPGEQPHAYCASNASVCHGASFPSGRARLASRPRDWKSSLLGGTPASVAQHEPPGRELRAPGVLGVLDRRLAAFGHELRGRRTH